MIKKLISIFAMLILLSTPALAQEQVKPGVTPDSFLWQIDRAFEKARLTFTFNESDRARYNMRIAEERLAEVQAVQNFKNVDNETVQRAVQKAERERTRAIERAMNSANKSRNKNVMEMVQNKTRKHIEVLKRNLEKVPEQAKEGIRNAIENSQRVIENFDVPAKSQK